MRALDRARNLFSFRTAYFFGDSVVFGVAVLTSRVGFTETLSMFIAALHATKIEVEMAHADFLAENLENILSLYVFMVLFPRG